MTSITISTIIIIIIIVIISIIIIIHKGGFSKGRFSNTNKIIKHKLLNPNPPLWTPDDRAAHAAGRLQVPGELAELHVLVVYNILCDVHSFKYEATARPRT